MIPTLQKWCDDATAAEFWAKHDEQQAVLDAQSVDTLTQLAGLEIEWDPASGHVETKEIRK